MKRYLNLFFLTVSIFFHYSCCDKCALGFKSSERAFLPYSDNQEIIFTSTGLPDTVSFKFGKTTTEEFEKQCNGFPERHCYLTLAQYGKSSGTSLGSDFELKISTFQDHGFTLSLFMVTSRTRYQYAGKVYSGHDVDNEFIPDYDTLTVGNKLCLSVYKITGPENPIVPQTLNHIVEFYFSKDEGLIRFKTKDGRIWDLLN